MVKVVFSKLWHPSQESRGLSGDRLELTWWVADTLEVKRCSASAPPPRCWRVTDRPATSPSANGVLEVARHRVRRWARRLRIEGEWDDVPAL